MNLEEENLKLKEIQKLKEKLQSYTNRPSKNKNYYEKHKDVILEKRKQKYQENKVKTEKET